MTEFRRALLRPGLAAGAILAAALAAGLTHAQPVPGTVAPQDAGEVPPAAVPQAAAPSVAVPAPAAGLETAAPAASAASPGPATPSAGVDGTGHDPAEAATVPPAPGAQVSTPAQPNAPAAQPAAAAPDPGASAAAGPTTAPAADAPAAGTPSAPAAAPKPAPAPLPRRAALAPPAHARAPSADYAPAVRVAGPADTGLLAAHAAYVDGDADRVAAYAPQVAGSLLESYVSYWQVSARLRGPVPDDTGVRPFLARFPGTLLADRLRAEWLMELATKGDLATFDAERRRLVLGGDDAQLSCYTLLARYALDDGHRREQIGREARRTLALTSDPGGEGCTALAERLMDDGVLSIWPRLQALIERGQVTAALTTSQRLPPADAAALKAALQNPADWLAAADAHLAQTAHPVPLLGIVALARDAPERAAYYADHLDASLSPEERAMVWGRIGRSGQLNLAPDAHAWFERGGELVGLGPDYVRANEVLEARVRAALRRGASGVAAAPIAAAAGARPAPAISAPIEADQGAAGAAAGPDWAAVRRGIAHMPAEQQADSTWVYWNAHAALALGQMEEGRAGLQSIADRFSYYGRLAAEELGLPMHLPARSEDAPEAVVEQLSLRPGLQRARKLFELGLRDEGNREWNWELRGMDDVYLHAAAELARRLGVLDRMIASSERTRAMVDIAQRYPMPYRDFMTATAAPLGVDAAWIYGLIRQESRFMEDIRSNAGAVGLMQLMPATARFVAHRIGFDHYRADRIGEVNVNLRLGTEYLKLVSDDQDGQPMLASAAYNAGPSRVRRWRAALVRPLDGAIFAETIPIGETRDYVKKVLFNTVVYASMLDRPAVSLHALLPAVSPKGIPATELP